MTTEEFNMQLELEEVINLKLGTNHSLAPSQHLRNDLGVDSLDLINLVMHIEKELDIVIQDFEMKRWQTVGDMLNAIYRLKHEAAHASLGV